MKKRLVSGRRALLLAGLVSVATGAEAFETLDFQSPGADTDLSDALRSASLLVASEDEDTTDTQELLAAARADYGRLVGALYAEGHFGGVVSIRIDGREAADIPPLDAPATIDTITVRVTPGPTYLFDRAEVVPLAPDTELPEEFAVGEAAKTTAIRDAATAGVDGWREDGRAMADVADQEITAKHDEDRLSARILLEPGPAVRFGELILKGAERVRPERIREIAGLPVGGQFSPTDLKRSAERLRRTGAFRSVTLTEAETLNADGTLDITATVDEEKPRRFGFGAEISSVDGLTLSSFWLHRNLLGGAERFRIDGEIGSIGAGTGGEDYTLGARFERPAQFGPNVDLYLESSLEYLEEPTYTSQTGSIGGGIIRRLGDTLVVEAGIAYRFSHISDELGTRDFNLITFPIDASYDKRDNALNATEGYYAKVTTTPFLGVAGSESGVRLTFDGRTYYGFGAEDRVVLAGRIQGGSVAGASILGVPNDYRFFSGGGGTVRGVPYQQLGVTVNGEKTGGLSYLGLSAELRTKVTDKIGLVAFADYGTVSAESVPGSGGQSHAGAGLGLRYLTPIGPIRLDVATPVSGPDTADNYQFYIGIGQAF